MTLLPFTKTYARLDDITFNASSSRLANLSTCWIFKQFVTPSCDVSEAPARLPHHCTVSRNLPEQTISTTEDLQILAPDISVTWLGAVVWELSRLATSCITLSRQLLISSVRARFSYDLATARRSSTSVATKPCPRSLKPTIELVSFAQARNQQHRGIGSGKSFTLVRDLGLGPLPGRASSRLVF